MHSSRMRTGRSLTVCWRLLPGGCACRGVYLPGGVPAQGGTCPGGVYLPGGYLPWGVPARGVGVSGLGGWGVCLPGGCGVCLRHASPVNRMTDRCKNITLATTSLRPVTTSKKSILLAVARLEVVVLLI